MPQDDPTPKTEETAETPFQKFRRLAQKIVSAPKAKLEKSKPSP